MSGGQDFRTKEEEVIKLLEECAELKRLLTSISAQIARIENRVKHSFPNAAMHAKERRISRKRSEQSTLNSDQALDEFDKIVRLAASGNIESAEQRLGEIPAPNLLIISREIGVPFSKSRPSIRAMREAILGKIRESVLLTRHNTRK